MLERKVWKRSSQKASDAAKATGPVSGAAAASAAASAAAASPDALDVTLNQEVRDIVSRYVKTHVSDKTKREAEAAAADAGLSAVDRMPPRHAYQGLGASSKGAPARERTKAQRIIANSGPASAAPPNRYAQAVQKRRRKRDESDDDDDDDHEDAGKSGAIK